MTSLDSSLAKKNKKYKQKVNIKAKFTHHHPSPEIEKELSPWDEDDHFIQLPKNPLTMSLQYLLSKTDTQSNLNPVITALNCGHQNLPV